MSEIKPFEMVDIHSREFDRALRKHLLDIQDVEQKYENYRREQRQRAETQSWWIAATGAAACLWGLVCIALVHIGRIPAGYPVGGFGVATLIHALLYYNSTLDPEGRPFTWRTRGTPPHERLRSSTAEGFVTSVLLVLAPPIVPLIALIDFRRKVTPFDDPTHRLERQRNDNRYGEYCALLEHIALWNSCVETLNRLILKIEHNQLSPEMIPEVMAQIAAAQEDEEQLRDHINFCTALAQQGDLGTQTTRQLVDTASDIDALERLTKMRERIEEIRGLDPRTRAEKEVEALSRRR